MEVDMEEGWGVEDWGAQEEEREGKEGEEGGKEGLGQGTAMELATKEEEVIEV